MRDYARNDQENDEQQLTAVLNYVKKTHGIYLKAIYSFIEKAEGKRKNKESVPPCFVSKGYSRNTTRLLSRDSNVTMKKQSRLRKIDVNYPRDMFPKQLVDLGHLTNHKLSFIACNNSIVMS